MRVPLLTLWLKVNRNERHLSLILFFACLIANNTSIFTLFVVILRYIECDGQSWLASAGKYNLAQNILEFYKILVEVPFTICKTEADT